MGRPKQMRVSSSHHVESIQLGAADIFSGHKWANFRPALNFKALCELLQQNQVFNNGAASEASPSSGKGKKRSLTGYSHDLRPSKRIKMSEGLSDDEPEDNERNSIELDDIQWPDSHYPPLNSRRTASRNSKTDVNHDIPILQDTFPALQHTFEIQYADQPHSDLEKVFLRIIASHQTLEPQIIDLGDVNLVQYLNRLVVGFTPVSNRVRCEWLLLLPSYSKDVDLAWLDISSHIVKDIMAAAYVLQSTGRASITTRLKMIILPSGACDVSEEELPFRFQIEANVSFRAPEIFTPIPRQVQQAKTLPVEDAQRRLLEYLFPSKSALPVSAPGPINVSFFHSILPAAPPLPSESTMEAMQPPKLLSTLLPFQRRSLAWLLDREGKVVLPNGEVVPKPQNPGFSFWEKIEYGDHIWYINRVTGNVSPLLPDTEPVVGGILAEEPGLGKTLESIALILMNPAPLERGPSIVRRDEEAQINLKAIKSTLIVTPPALASQWADELAAHAPSLKVLIYDGWSKITIPTNETQAIPQTSKNKLKLAEKSNQPKGRQKTNSRGYNEDSSDEDMDTDAQEDEPKSAQHWAPYVNEFDVVITTYAVLRSDLHVARPAPERPRRMDVRYSNVERARSPLVSVEWYRVIMDEVQMAGGGKTEDMVSLIPRVSSLAVSGTPARQQTADLLHVLKFLRVNDVVGSTRVWNRLISSSFGVPHFTALFQAYCIRTLKENVKAELTIPRQTRCVVSITLGPVEKHVYDQALEALLQELGLDARGVAASEGWEIDGAALRSGLRRLRGLCTHPQVGQLQKTGDKLFKPGAVKTMEDVLQNMKETNWRTMMDSQRAKVQALIRLAQLQARDENDENCFQHALTTLALAEKDALALVNDANAASEQLKSESRSSTETPRTDKGKQRRTSEDPANGEPSGGEISEGEEEMRSNEHDGKRRGALQNRLRECRIVLHRAKFLQGDMYHALGIDHSASEDAAYSAAEGIRRELLKGTEDDAHRVMELLRQDATTNQITQDALLTGVPFLETPVLLAILEAHKPTKAELKAKPKPYNVIVSERVQSSVDLVEEANSIIQDVLNKQSTLLWEWRSHITTLLTQKLASSEDQPDGEEYQRTLDNQGDAEMYLQSYAALLSDRRQALLNERTLLAAHDLREKKKRRTKAAMNAASAAQDLPAHTSNEIEVQPEHQVLFSELSHRRQDLLDDLEGRAIKSVIVDLNSAATGLKRDNDAEKISLKEAVSQLKQFMNEQVALMDKLDADLALVRKAFNHRILYFRQLQEISDTVAEVTWDGSIVEALLQTTAEKNELEVEIHKTRARQRYLENLTKTSHTDVIEDEHCCILCRCEFVRGFITQCAHVFCEGCMRAWLLRKEGKACPVCRVAVNPDTIERFTVVPDAPVEPEPEKKPVLRETVPRSHRHISYNIIDTSLFAEIRSMESFGDYGSKIQTLIRHLLYIKATDPGAKSIVFSAWADSLRIIEQGLKLNDIHCLRIDQGSKGKSAAKRFKDNPKLLVLLLHGERENAGLNITCASRVFLLESVVHHGFEIQAIARIDRMGQTRPTEVYCYYAEDTVERNILDLASRKGLSLYTKENSAGTLNFSSLTAETDTKVDGASKKKTQKGDFIFKLNDMLAILFPHMFEDLEYLIPPSDLEAKSSAILQPATKYSAAENAVAGPSRLN